MLLQELSLTLKPEGVAWLIGVLQALYNNSKLGMSNPTPGEQTGETRRVMMAQ